jgi:hypothetical protein
VTRLLSWVPILFLVSLLAFPAVASAQGPGDERGVLVGVREALTLDAGSSASVVVGVQGQVTVSGHARLLVMVDGDVILTGTTASVDTLVAVRAHVTLGPGTTVGTIRALDSTITQDPTATVQNGIEDLQGSMFVLVGILGTFLLLLYLGWAVAVLIAGVFVAAIAPSQTRRMARSVASEPLKVLGAGVLGFLVPLIVGVILFVTVIGIPLGVMVLMALGLAAFLGYIVMGIWLGDLLLRRGRSPADGRPIGSALLGVFLLLIVSVIPLVSFFVGWFGLGTVTLNAWRALVGRGGSAAAGPGEPAWAGLPPTWAAAPTGPAGWPPQPPQSPQPPQGWGQPPTTSTPATGWGTPGSATPGTQQWGQPPAGQPPAGPPPGWGQPPGQGR